MLLAVNNEKSSTTGRVGQATNGSQFFIEMVTSFKEKMEAVGNRCDLILYKDQGHAFFAKKPIKYFIETTHEIDKFLVSLGYLNGNSTINNQYN